MVERKVIIMFNFKKRECMLVKMQDLEVRLALDIVKLESLIESVQKIEPKSEKVDKYKDYRDENGLFVTKANAKLTNKSDATTLSV